MGARFSRGIRRSEYEGSSLPRAIRFIERQVGPSRNDGDAPIFLLSAGWRSGSTLLQRLITSDPSVLMWGEPFEDFGVVHRLARTVEFFGPDTAHLRYAIDRFEGPLSNEWIANLNPGLAPLRLAHREFFEQMFAVPARENGHPRWGCKWVRLTAGHAHYLKWLYPAARFVFLVRHPFHSLQSYQGRQWFYMRPHMQVTRAWQFLDHWTSLADSFVSEYRALGATLVRYEDVVSADETVRALSAHLDVRIDRGVLENRIGASKSRKAAGPSARLFLSRRGRDLCEQFGYTLSGEVHKREPF